MFKFVIYVPPDLVVALFQLLFPPGGGPQSSCTDVTITSDDGLEEEESFMLTLGSSDPARVMIGTPAITSVVITDTDGEYINIHWV